MKIVFYCLFYGTVYILQSKFKMYKVRIDHTNKYGFQNCHINPLAVAMTIILLIII